MIKKLKIKEKNYLLIYAGVKWRPPSLSELTPMVFNTGLTHLGLKATIYGHPSRKFDF